MPRRGHDFAFKPDGGGGGGCALGTPKWAGLIALTNRLDSALGRESDVALCANLDGLPWAGENAAARLVQLSILDALLSAVAQKNCAAAQANHGWTTAASGRSGF